MKHIFTLAFIVASIGAFAQQPSYVGTDVADGVIYTEYALLDHGVVSSYRIMAQNTVSDTSLEWNFIAAAGDYSLNWRPYNTGEVYSGFNAIIDPATDPASARYNSGFGGQPCAVASVQAGMYYTFIVENNELADNRMNIVETDFDPVVMDTVYHSPEMPTSSEMVTFTVELDGSMMPSVGEHIFIRYSIDGFATSSFAEITNFAAGVGSVQVPAFAEDTTVTYYALSTNQAAPDAATIDFWTLYFGNNANQNYSFTVPIVTGIEENDDSELIISDNRISISNGPSNGQLELFDITGKRVSTTSFNSRMTMDIDLTSGLYVARILNGPELISTRKFVLK